MTTGIVGMSTAAGAAATTDISATDIKVASGITPLDTQKTQLVGSVLDLFSGKPSCKIRIASNLTSVYKLSFWKGTTCFVHV